MADRTTIGIGGLTTPNTSVYAQNSGMLGSLPNNLSSDPRSTNQGVAVGTNPAANLSLSGKVFSAFEPGDIVPDNKQTVTEAIWSTGTGSLKTFFTSSTQSASSGNYYYNIYQLDPSSSAAVVQFALAYGNIYGSGSNDISDSSNVAGLSPSRAIYSQYRNILLDPSDNEFTLGDNVPMNDFIVINFNRQRLKERLDAGNWQLCVSGSAGGKLVHLIDDYDPTANESIETAGRVHNIVSGTISDGIYNSTAPHYYGLSYPDFGVMLISGNKLNYTASVSMLTASLAEGNNHQTFLNAMKRAADASTITNDYGFQCRNEVEINSTYYFVRVKNGDYNFSNNPTFTSGSYGDFRHTEMYRNPSVYITTVGLYDNSNELLATAKLSKPLLKTFSREVLLRIRLDY